MLFKNMQYLERIKKTNKLIKEQQTGSPTKFASKLSIRRSQLYNILDSFKIIGASIKYCRKRETFYYEDLFDLQINYSVKVIKKESIENICGGSIIVRKNSFRTMKLDGTILYLQYPNFMDKSIIFQTKKE